MRGERQRREMRDRAGEGQADVDRVSKFGHIFIEMMPGPMGVDGMTERVWGERQPLVT